MAEQDAVKAFEVDRYSSFGLICLDCDETLYFSADSPAPHSPGFHSNLNFADVVKTAEAHDCEVPGA